MTCLCGTPGREGDELGYQLFEGKSEDKPWQNPKWHMCWVSIPPACSLGHSLAAMGSCLAGPGSAPICPAAMLSIIQMVFYAKGMPSQKGTNPPLAASSLAGRDLSWVSSCGAVELMPFSLLPFSPRKADGNTCSSHHLKCLLQDPIFGVF